MMSIAREQQHASLPGLAVMLSGSGRTLANLLEHIRSGQLHARVSLVIASRECGGAEIARRSGLPTLVEPGDIPLARLRAMLVDAGADWLVLAGYLRRVAIPREFAGRVVNIHPALLPAFGGDGMYGLKVHEAVLASGASESGCSVHICDAEYDRGPLVLQERCPVLPGDTPHTLAERVFELEKQVYPRALELLISRDVKMGGAAGGRPG